MIFILTQKTTISCKELPKMNVIQRLHTYKLIHMNATTARKQKSVSRDSYSFDLHSVICIELKSFCKYNEYKVCHTMSNIYGCFNCIAWLSHDFMYVHEIWIVFVLWRCLRAWICGIWNALSLSSARQTAHTIQTHRINLNEYSLISFWCYSYILRFILHPCTFLHISSFEIFCALSFTTLNVNACVHVCICCVLVYPLNNKTFTSAIDNLALFLFRVYSITKLRVISIFPFVYKFTYASLMNSHVANSCIQFIHVFRYDFSSPFIPYLSGGDKENYKRIL